MFQQAQLSKIVSVFSKRVRNTGTEASIRCSCSCCYSCSAQLPCSPVSHPGIVRAQDPPWAQDPQDVPAVFTHRAATDSWGGAICAF